MIRISCIVNSCSWSTDPVILSWQCRRAWVIHCCCWHLCIVAYVSHRCCSLFLDLNGFTWFHQEGSQLAWNCKSYLHSYLTCFPSILLIWFIPWYRNHRLIFWQGYYIPTKLSLGCTGGGIHPWLPLSAPLMRKDWLVCQLMMMIVMILT